MPPQLADQMIASMESHNNKREFDSMNNHLKLISDQASHAYPLQKTSKKQTSKKQTEEEDEPEEVITYLGTQELKDVWYEVKTSDIRKYSLMVPLLDDYECKIVEYKNKGEVFCVGKTLKRWMYQVKNNCKCIHICYKDDMDLFWLENNQIQY